MKLTGAIPLIDVRCRLGYVTPQRLPGDVARVVPVRASLVDRSVKVLDDVLYLAEPRFRAAHRHRILFTRTVPAEDLTGSFDAVMPHPV
jgi:hypothetical protein